MTTQPKHTPGPWEKNGLDINGDGWFLARVNGKRDPGVGSAEAHANARLIAAAPSMADAIRALLAEIDADADCPSVGAIRALRDSLAKAEGR